MNTQIYEEATTWFVELRVGRADQRQRRKFDAWIRASPEHLRAYLEVAEIWQDAAFVETAGHIGIEALIAHAHEHTNITSLEVSRSPYGVQKLEREPVPVTITCGAASRDVENPKPTAVKARLFAIAASLLLILGIAGASTWLITQRNIYATEIGEQRTITLADGSIVQLNARSKIKVQYTDQRRAIALLKGQALFSVAKNPLRPFIVDTGTSRIRAVGTQFDVYKKRDRTFVTVIEGRVAVVPDTAPAVTPRKPATPSSKQPAEPTRDPQAAPASNQLVPTTQALVIAGEQATITSSGAVHLQPVANIAAATAWTQRRLIFDGAPLTEVVEEFNRYNTRQFTLLDPQLSHFQISGVYASTDPALLLRFLSTQTSIEVKESDTEIQISRK